MIGCCQIRRAILRSLVGAAMAIVLALTASATAEASSIITRSDLTGTTFTNPCTAEQFTITSGTFQLIVNTMADGAGGIHLDVRGNAQGVAAQGLTSGDMYRLAGDFWSEQTIRDGNYPLTLTVVEVHNAVSAGSAPNLIIHIVRHLTINAGGQVTASVEAVSAECQG